MTDKYEALKAANAAIQALVAQRDALAAKLAELEKQEPVAWRVWSPDGVNVYFYSEDGDGEPLYLSPGAQSQDAARYRTVLGMSSEKLLQLYNTRFDLREQFIDSAMAQGAK